MARDACSPLHIKHALGRNLFPLGDGLRADYERHRTGQARSALDDAFGIIECGCFQFVYTRRVAHPALKAQLSQLCKHLFR